MVFPTRRCAGLPSAGFPKDYTSTVNLSGITFTDAGIDPRPKGVEGTIWTIRDTAVALYSTAAGPATNQAALDDLATRAAQDFFDSRSVRFDKVYSGINSIPPNALIDVISFVYTSTTQTTRIRSLPFGGEARESQHQDPAISACHADDRNPGVLMDIPGAPINSSMTGVVSLEDGRLVLTYDATTSVPCSCTPSTPPCGTICVALSNSCDGSDIPGATVTVKKSGTVISTCTTSPGQVVSVAVTFPGTGYSSVSPPAVTLSGGGGSGAAATATVLFGNVAAIRVTNGGGGYTSNPAVTIAPPASGSTARATATIGSRCCANVFSSGTSGQYTVDLVKSGFTTRANISVGAVACTGSSITPQSLTMTPSTATLSVCAQGPCNGSINSGTPHCSGVAPLPGASVVVKQSGSTVASGTADGDGFIAFAGLTPGVTYTVEASLSPRVVVGGTTTVTLSACGSSVVAPTAAASGYHCFCVGTCIIPAADTLILTDSVLGGAVTLTHTNSGTFSGQSCWEGSRTVGVGACGGCIAAAGVTVSYQLNDLGSGLPCGVVVRYTNAGGGSCAGGGPGTSGYPLFSAFGTTACPPALSATFGGPGTSPSSGVYCGVSPTLTVTE